MKPLNLDNNSCSPISSNCVIWQGPNIPCIKLCTGDSITDVIYALATELCTIVDAVNISTLDLSCLEITTGDPTNLNELLQILIDKICALNNIPTSTTSTKRGNSTCPTDCVVPVAECLQTGGQTTMKLLDYIQLIGNKICSILTDISTINNSITNLTKRVTILESVPPTPPYVLPSVTPDCTLADDTVESGIAYQLDVILEALINDDNHGYCALLASTGQPSEITTAYLSQPVSGTEVALSNCSQTLDEHFGTDWFSSPGNLSQSFTDLWLTVKDLRDAYKTYTVVSGNSNVTVTPTTNTTACGPELQFAVKAKGSSVIAGSNITVTSNEVDGNTAYTVNATSKNTTVVAGDNITVAENTSNPNNTIYTVTGKEAIVTASTATNNTVTVTPTTSGNDTTYELYSKYGLDMLTVGWSMGNGKYGSWMDIPGAFQEPTVCTAPQYFTPTLYGLADNSNTQIMIKPNYIQTTAALGPNANKNVMMVNYGSTPTSYVQQAAFDAVGNTFATVNVLAGTITIKEAGVYYMAAYIHLKPGLCSGGGGGEGKSYWMNDYTLNLPVVITGGGSGVVAVPQKKFGTFGLGIIPNNDTDVYVANYQPIISGVTTQIDISTSRTAFIGQDSVFRLSVLNVSDRNYNPQPLTGSDGMSITLIKLSDGFLNL